MKAFIYTIILALLTGSNVALAQEVIPAPKANHIYYSIGLSCILLPHIKPNLYAPSSISMGGFIGLTYERAFTSRHSFVSGIAYTAYALELDAVLNTSNEVVAAPDSVKYGRISQSSILLPLGYRFYYNKKSNRFFQVEAGLGYSFGNNYYARINGTDGKTTLNDASRFLYSAGIGLGKTHHTGRLVKSTIIKVNYNLNPYFSNSGAGDLHPLLFTFAIML